jgi:hypothetical protein
LREQRLLFVFAAGRACWRTLSKGPVYIMTPRRFTIDASASGTLKELLRQAHELLRLEDDIGALMAPSIRPHCRAAGCRDGQLILMTDSPAWATRLRYQVPALLAGLRRRAPALGLREIHVKVSPFAQPVEAATGLGPTMSEASAALLEDVASGIGDARIRAAMLRLAGRRSLSPTKR